MEPEFTLKFVDHKIDGKTVWYTVQVNDRKTGKNWQFQSRFSQLLDIHTLSEQHFPKGELPDFPPKKMFGNTNPDFVVRRKKELENYYNTLLKSIEISKLPELRALLEEHRPRDQKPAQPKVVSGNKPVQAEPLPSQQAQLKKKFDETLTETVSRFIDISNDYFDPPDEGMIKRKKLMFDKIRVQMKSKLLPSLQYPKGCAENYGQFWAVSYFDQKKQFVRSTSDMVKSLRLKDILRQEGLSERIVKVV